MTGPTTSLQETLLRILFWVVLVAAFLWKLLFGDGAKPEAQAQPLPVRLLKAEMHLLDDLLSDRWSLGKWIAS